MKFIHIGDLHIGKSLHDFNLIDDQRFILNQIFEIAQEKSVDGVLIAGDVYDKSVPSEEAVRLFNDFLVCLSEAGLKVFLISGNHDSDERLNFGSRLFQTNQIYIAAKYEGVLPKLELMDEEGKINVYLLPFVKASQVRHFFPEEVIDSYDKAVRVILEHTQIDGAERNVLVAHQFVAGKGEEPVLSGSEGAAVQNVGLVEKISPECFSSFDYVALGHIHSPQRVGREEVRYSGSPLKYSLSEIHSKKSVPVVTIGKKGKVQMEFVPLVPKRDVRHIKGTLAQLLDKKNMVQTEDFIYATLTDEAPINDAIGIFRQYYPNTVKIDYDNAHSRELEQVNLTKQVQEKSFSEMISDFYQLIYGCEMSEEEMEIMNEAAKEAGLVNETN